MMRLIDISRTIRTDALVYPGDPPLRVSPLSTIGPQSPYAITRLDGWTTHVLTHVDAPAHFVAGGASLDEIPLDRFAGDALVVEIGLDADVVRAAHLPVGDDLAGVSLLFKTRNSARAAGDAFDENHVYVGEDAARAIVDRGVGLVGIDYLSVDRYGDEAYPAHRTLLDNGVLVLEGIDLAHVGAGRYVLFALPLKIAAGDGSPVRAVLMPQERLQEQPQERRRR
jgi:arylformamidase